MNVSTVFPEGYVDNERVHQSSTAARKQDKNSDEEERLRRKWCFSDILHWYFPNPVFTARNKIYI
jgi:tagatose-1,6-bisphosphate aldolase non-catalytic subunit AgaZ/GatZ